MAKSIFSFEDYYSKAWKKVDSLMQKGLPKSALEVVNEIYTRARNEENSAQWVKSIIHKLLYIGYVEENSLVKSLNELRTECENAKYPVKPLLHSMMAEIYWQYFQNNRWRFYNRSQTVDFKQDDIQTWDLKKIVEETLNQHLNALKYPEQLKNYKIDIYDEILVKGRKEERLLRTTLYDFVAHRAIDFLMSSESDLTKPAYQFVINDPAYLKDAQSFMQMKLESRDTLSFKFHALRLLQDVMKFHSNHPNKEVFADVDLKRLTFVYQQLTSPDKDKLYLELLQKMEQQYSQLPVTSEIIYRQASILSAQGEKYNGRVSEENKWKMKEAYDLCQKGITRFPNSDGAQNCRSLQNNITSKSLRLMAEEVVPVNEYSKVWVEYRNVPQLHWRAVKIDRNDLRRLSRQSYYEEKLIEFYTKKTADKQWTSTLPDDKDYQKHAVEEKIPGLLSGEYILMASDNAQFKYKNNAVAYAFIKVSNISYVHRNLDKEMEFYLMHRNSGAALANVRAEIYGSEYNYTRGEYVDVKLGEYLSDREGYFKVPLLNDKYRNFSARLFGVNDALNTTEIGGYYSYGGFYLYENYQERVQDTRTYFFLDRAIYRPGQTIYFKGVVIRGDGEENQIVPNFETVIYLYDVNSQLVNEVKLTTNEYGTFSGKLTAPATGLTGNMRISNFPVSAQQTLKHKVATGENLYRIARKYNISEASVKNWNNLKDDKIAIGQELTIYQTVSVEELGSISFSVEEYKRPKFEVKFDPVKGSYRLNEEITAIGNAKAYSGANIDGAEVKYRVVRKARFPYWWFYWRGYYPVSPEMEILNGNIQTDASGQFKITFRAIPDPAVDKDSGPVFTYMLYADVTDINGETRSEQSSVSVAYRALELNLELPDDELDKSAKQEIKIVSSNLGGEYEPSKGLITIHKLKSPDKAYRNRKWERPDKYIYSKEDWQKTFPKDLYGDENNFYRWDKEKNVLETAYDTEKSKLLVLENLKSWEPGKYMAEISSKDKYGEEVKEVIYFTLMDYRSKTTALPTVSYFSASNKELEPGEKAEIKMASSENNLRALFEIEHQGKIVDKKWISLNNEMQLLDLPIKEAYRGNVGLHYTFVKDNRLYAYQQTLQVPMTNKELDISFETYRDKLQPGQEEEWRIRIKGKKGDKVAAEMVAALYDASLDAFRANNWYFNIYNTYYNQRTWQSLNCFDHTDFRLYSQDWNPYVPGAGKYYDYLNWYGFSYNSFYYRGGRERREEYNELDRSTVSNATKSKKNGEKPAPTTSEEPMEEVMLNADVAGIKAEKEEDNQGNLKDNKSNGGDKKTGDDLSGVKARTNFNETAFFYPHLQTDANGDILIKFTVPEALTRWKMLGFAHSKDLRYGLAQNALVTQKDLMVVPNAPRFFRENDKMAFASKITNVTDKDLNGTAQLYLVDAISGKAVDKELDNSLAQQSFEVKAGQSIALNWSISIPAGMQALTYKVVAKAGNFSDGEEMTLPVLTNSMLVTETLPLPVRSRQTKTFTLEKLLASNKSTTLRNEKLTLEFTSNPTWYAVQALPYLMEFPHECAEQLFSRYYANSLATHIANSTPKIKAVFESWKNITPDALLSNLDKNPELKSLMLEETPWVLQANSEAQRKQQVGLLFDLVRMSGELQKALTKLIQKQVSSGGWPWFEGMPEDRYITQHIVSGMGHLDKLGIKAAVEDARTRQMIEKAVGFLDRKIEEDLEELKRLEKRGLIKLSDDHLGYLQIHYLYGRSFFNQIAIPKRSQEAFDYFKGQAQKYWLNKGRYMQGMLALALFRNKDTKTPADIVKSFRERALISEEMGMYWKEDYGYYWYQAPIESHALMIEVFTEIVNDTKAVDDLKTWLLKQKQTQDWKTTKATAEACYALLLQGSNWLASEEPVEITLGDKKINTQTEAGTLKAEAGTGYFKTSWKKEEISADMGKITVSKKDDGVAWGAVYWQYFEQLDKITPAETPLKLKKQLFLQKDSDQGPVITPITTQTPLKVGDLVKVRIELRVDRTMEYVHMKDMRASGFEPLNVLSRYKWQDGLGYYESTRDAATHFFIGWLNKGTYVFEYPLRVTHEGDFSNGITTIQCMYAPEFASHSEGIRVKVNKK